MLNAIINNEHVDVVSESRKSLIVKQHLIDFDCVSVTCTGKWPNGA